MTQESLTIFQQIINRKIPATFLYEDKDFIAILDAFPLVEGQSLIISKKLLPSKFTENTEKFISKAMAIAKKIALAIEKGLEVERVVIVVEGLEVNHFHIKLFPVKDKSDFSLTGLSGRNANAPKMIDSKNAKVLKEKIAKFL